MTEPTRSLGLSRFRVNASSTSFSSPTARTHALPEPPKAGERRTKTPLRARKIINTMDRGLQESRERAQEVKEIANVKGKEKSGMSMVERRGESVGEADGNRGKEVQTEAVILLNGKLVRRPYETYDQRSVKRSKTVDGWKQASSTSKPKQTYLAPTRSDSTPSSNREVVEPTDSPFTLSAGLSRKSCSLPRVPLFSTASRREIQSLTSRKALQDEKNPITHSTVGAGTLHYISSSTGHQQANRVGVANASASEGWWHTRMRKLKDQAGSEEKQSDLFRGLSIYINGYAGAQIGNKELQRLLSLNGAEVHYLPNAKTTHIVSEMPLSAKKTQEMLQLKACRVKKFVKVDWILDSLEAGKRKPEHPYAHPIPVQRGIAHMLNSHSSGKATSPGVASTRCNDDGSCTFSLLSQDWREAGRNAAALSAATFTDRQKRCS